MDAALQRTRNRATDPATGRILQVVAGMRPYTTGAFRFMIQSSSLRQLEELPNVWVAFVPSAGDTMILAPLSEVAWRGRSLDGTYVMIRFDDDGAPIYMQRWAAPMTFAGEHPARR